MISPLAYRPLASPLHAARASAAACWAGCLLAAALLFEHPLLLGAIAVATLIAAAAAGVGARIARTLRYAAILGVPLVLLNVLLSRQGLTVFARIGDLGPFGQGDLTLEALVYGLVVALKVTVAILICALASVTIDPDDLLASCRRLSFRAALTASLTLRMVPLLAADASRLAEAQRTRARDRRRRVRGGALLLTATVAGALDRALDIAATLELRGFGSAARVRPERRPLSRHDLAFVCCGLLSLALAIGASSSGAATFVAYPLLRCRLSIETGAFCLAIVVVPLLPFLDRRGIEPR